MNEVDYMDESTQKEFSASVTRLGFVSTDNFDSPIIKKPIRKIVLMVQRKQQLMHDTSEDYKRSRRVRR